jgi:hypothetical protein
MIHAIHLQDASSSGITIIATATITTSTCNPLDINNNKNGQRAE